MTRLLALNGYDGFGGLDTAAWMRYTERLATQLHLRPQDTVFEVGCGAGAFMYPFYQHGHVVAGIDYAENLVHIARQVMPQADFQTREATDINPAEACDVVLAHSVFFYFQNLTYAAAVLAKMIQKARKTVAILDVPDVARKEESLARRCREMGTAEYEKKYAGLAHLFFDRNWFVEAARNANMTVHIEDQYIPGYAHNAYRFNVFLTKRGPVP